MKCEDCCHAEMCKWIDELEGRGCDFFDGDPCIDAVSRKNAVRCVLSSMFLAEASEKIEKLPSVNPQPCDDAISRDMALEKMADYVASGYADSAEDFEEYSRIICQLPPVTQRPIECDDAISRKDVINAIDKWISEYKPQHYLIQSIRELPSVNPQASEHFIDGVHAMGYREGYKDAQKQKSGEWIPVSKRLPEDAYGCLVTVYDTDLRTQDEFENILPYFVGYDGETWNNADGEPIPFEVVAWMKLPAPYEPQERSE